MHGFGVLVSVLEDVQNKLYYVISTTDIASVTSLRLENLFVVCKILIDSSCSLAKAMCIFLHSQALISSIEDVCTKVFDFKTCSYCVALITL